MFDLSEELVGKALGKEFDLSKEGNLIDVDIIDEKSEINSKFNVMPGRNVSETLYIKKYIVTKNKVIASFDREYMSEMERSPDHLIFTTALYHTQKMMYLAVAKNLGFKYEPEQKEQFKIWPYFLEINLPKLVTTSKDVIQVLNVDSFRQIDEKRYDLEVRMNVNDRITTTVSAFVKLI